LGKEQLHLRGTAAYRLPFTSLLSAHYCANTALDSHLPAAECHVLEKVDTFLRVKHEYQAVYRETFLAAMDAIDVDGCKPVWTSRLDKARYK
jgi:hypothetical protein